MPNPTLGCSDDCGGEGDAVLEALVISFVNGSNASISRSSRFNIFNILNSTMSTRISVFEFSVISVVSISVFLSLGWQAALITLIILVAGFGGFDRLRQICTRKFRRPVHGDADRRSEEHSHDKTDNNTTIR